MNKFKVGDRVAIYNDGVRFVGVVSFVVSNNCYHVDISSKDVNDKDYIFTISGHEKQLRKIYVPDCGPWKKGTKVKVWGTTERCSNDYQNNSPYCFRRGQDATVDWASADIVDGYEVTVRLNTGDFVTVHSRQLEMIG